MPQAPAPQHTGRALKLRPRGASSCNLVALKLVELRSTDHLHRRMQELLAGCPPLLLRSLSITACNTGTLVHTSQGEFWHNLFGQLRLLTHLELAGVRGYRRDHLGLWGAMAQLRGAFDGVVFGVVVVGGGLLVRKGPAQHCLAAALQGIPLAAPGRQDTPLPQPCLLHRIAALPRLARLA